MDRLYQDALDELVRLRNRDRSEFFQTEFCQELAALRAGLNAIGAAAGDTSLGKAKAAFLKEFDQFCHARNRQSEPLGWLNDCRSLEGKLAEAKKRYSEYFERYQSLSGDKIDPGLQIDLEHDGIAPEEGRVNPYVRRLNGRFVGMQKAVPAKMDHWIAQLEGKRKGQIQDATFFRAYLCCGAYGDERNLTLEVVSGIVNACDLSPSLPISTVVDRVLVHGCMLPWAKDGRQFNWDTAWPRALVCLNSIVAGQLSGPLKWLRRFVYGNHPAEDGSKPDVGQELDLQAIQVASTMVAGCDCWKKWQDFAIDSPVRAMYYCVTSHQLAGWDRHEEIGRFVMRLVTFDAVRGKQLLPNGFRKGMLAKLAGPALQAGRVLRCRVNVADNPEPGNPETPCGGVIGLDDQCSINRDHERQPRRKDSWIWVKSSFAQHPAFRCGNCEQYFFSSRPPHWQAAGDECRARWGHRPSAFWYKLPLEPPAGEASSPHRPQSPLLRQALQDPSISSSDKSLLGALLSGHGELSNFAKSLGVDVFSPKLERRVVSLFSKLAKRKGGDPHVIRQYAINWLFKMRQERRAIDRYDYASLRKSISAWPNHDDVRSFAQSLLPLDDEPSIDSARRTPEVGFSRQMSHIWLQVIFRWMLEKPLQKVTEVQDIVAEWPDSEMKKFAEKAFKKPSSKNGRPKRASAESESLAAEFDSLQEKFDALPSDDDTARRCLVADALAKCRQFYRVEVPR
ncbi:MAG TPA: hypothetical protein VHC22_24060 [Pirellulales bacterium]|nr:hypothetical protein [Pirellulales bacterium]